MGALWYVFIQGGDINRPDSRSNNFGGNVENGKETAQKDWMIRDKMN